MSFVLILPVIVTTNLKELTPIIKMAKYGIIAIAVYGLFIFYIFFKNIFSEDWDIHKNDDKLGLHSFTLNFADIAGNYALAFFIHNVIV